MKRKPAERPFRFGVLMDTAASRRDLVAKYRKAEDIGCDVICVVDHLGTGAPFPALVLAGEATERPRLATSVLNAAFYNPALLAREICSLDQITNGRLDVGLGAGWAKAEFDSAGIRWPPPRERVAHLRRTVTKLQSVFVDPDHQPRPAQQGGPPLWLAGRGNKVLRLAAEHAKIVGFSGSVSGPDGSMPNLSAIDDLTERVRYVERHLGQRTDSVELNIHVSAVIITTDRRRVAENLAPYRGLKADQILRVPMFMIGTIAQIVEQLIEFRARFGFSYMTVGEADIDALAQVIEAMR